MGNVMLSEFIVQNRAALLARCRVKVALRSSLPPSDEKIDAGVSIFMDQLTVALQGEGGEASKEYADEIEAAATKHGHELFLRGFTISEVVHDYGDVCQSVTDLAVELKANITTDEFRTLNRCLDDAIAGAVAEYAREQDRPREGELHHLWNLCNLALTALDVLQSGNVGVSGSTAKVVHRNLSAIRAALASRMDKDNGPQSLDEFAIRR
jgi:hypothetical protein